MNLIYTLGSNPEKTIYDLGCMIGRHTVYFASHGYRVFASDISNDSIESRREWLLRENLTVELKQGHFLDVNYPENFLDLVIIMNVLNHDIKSEVYQIMQKVLKMLKKKKKFTFELLTLISSNIFQILLFPAFS